MSQINLLPWREKAKQRGLRRFRYKLTLSFVIGFGLISVIRFPLEYHTEELRNTALTLDNELTKLHHMQLRHAQIKKGNQDIQHSIELLEQLAANKTAILHFLQQLHQSVPKTIQLRKMVQQPNRIEIEGIAADHQAASIFIQQLNSLPQINQVSLSVVSQTDELEKSYSQFISTLHVLTEEGK